MIEKGIFRDGLKMEDDVSVTLPAHVWIQFTASFMSSSWDCIYAREVANAAHRAMLSQRFLNEQEAQLQMQRDQQEAMVKRMTGQTEDGSPGFPFPFGGHPA